MPKDRSTLQWDAIAVHKDRVKKLQDWLDEYKDAANGAETLACWSDHESTKESRVTLHGVDCGIENAGKEYAKLMQHLKNFVADYLTHGTA